MTERLTYSEIAHLSRDTIESMLAGDNDEHAAYAIISASLYDDDYGWLNNRSLEMLKSQNLNRMHGALLSLCNIVRRFSQLDVLGVIAILSEDFSSDGVAGQMNDLRDDIRIFMRQEPPF